MIVTDMSRRYRSAFYDMLRPAIADLPNSAGVQIVRGHPGAKQAQDILSVLDLQLDQDVATMSTNRTRECTLRLTLRAAVYRPGGPEQQEIAENRAYDLITAVEEYVRVTDTTLGGVVRHCFCTSHIFDPMTTLDVSKGRFVDIDAIFTATARITS